MKESQSSAATISRLSPNSFTLRDWRVLPAGLKRPSENILHVLNEPYNVSCCRRPHIRADSRWFSSRWPVAHKHLLEGGKRARRLVCQRSARPVWRASDPSSTLCFTIDHSPFGVYSPPTPTMAAELVLSRKFVSNTSCLFNPF